MESKTRMQPQQLIDQNKHFNRAAMQAVPTHLTNVEKEYNIVAIIGVQNSGKSTLLNNLFGTNFDVLHTIAGTRTTRGILTSLDKEQNLIVLDVQGNDAMDRAEQQQYQKMVSTFALVSADVLIINIWSMTLGQYTGSQYQQLNAILQICIDQFKQQSPKTILFCVRDFNDQVDDQGQIRRKIVKDVNNIWLKIQKPASLQKYINTPQKFFTVQVAILHKFKKQNPKNFLKDVQKLRQRFINSKQDGYIFKNKKNCFNLPLKDLPQLFQCSWKSITTNKKLNLPNEKQQLSNFRCSDILNELLARFKQQIIKIQQKKQVTDFGTIYDTYCKQFQTKTYNYGKNIVHQKQNTLKQQMKDSIKKVIGQIIDNQQKKAKQQCRTLSGYVNQDTSKSLQVSLNDIKNKAVQTYSSIYKTFNYEMHQQRKLNIKKLQKQLSKQMVQILKRHKEIIDAQFQKQCSRVIRLLSAQVVKEHFGKDFWSSVDKVYAKKRHELTQYYKKKVLWCENKHLKPDEIDQIDQKLSYQLKNCIRDEFEKSIINRVFDIFLKQFTRNKQGVAYNFNILEQAKIAQLYDQARDNARQIVSLINLYTIRRSKQSTILQFDQGENDQFFEATWLSTALTELDKKMIHQHETIIRRKKQQMMKKVPVWLFVFIIYFVYDDLWFSKEDYPTINFLLTVILVFITFFFAIGQGNAFIQLWTLFMQFFNEGVGSIRKKIGK